MTKSLTEMHCDTIRKVAKLYEKKDYSCDNYQIPQSIRPDSIDNTWNIEMMEFEGGQFKELKRIVLTYDEAENSPLFKFLMNIRVEFEPEEKPSWWEWHLKPKEKTWNRFYFDENGERL